MKIEYKIEENDYLEFQLFTASKSNRIRQRKVTSWILITLISLFSGGYFYLKNHLPMTIYFGITALISAILYPIYFKWRHKKHYKKHIRENYHKQFGTTKQLEITAEYIYSSDSAGEGKIKVSEVDEINETQNHFFLKISTGLSLIIPKREINDSDLLKNEMEGFGLKINNELNWKW
jgi:hypothetical protein